MNPQLQSITLDIDGMAVAGIRQHDPQTTAAPRLLCIHGWLDNANSFLPMMPYLPGFDLVAVDLPGHGYSDASPQGYAIHELCYQLTRVVTALGWSECYLAGHSLGGSIAPMLAVANASIVQGLVMIEASGPLSEEATRLPARMARSLQDRLHPERYRSRLFASKQEAIDARLKAASMDAASARLIIDRQLSRDDQGFRWRFDPRWRMASQQYLTEAQVHAILAAIDCRTLTVIAEDGYLVTRAETEARLRCLRMHHSVTLPGHHHLHMDTPEPVAAAINRFFETIPALEG